MATVTAKDKSLENKTEDFGILGFVPKMLSARIPVVWFVTAEEQRTETDVARLMGGTTWKGHQGFCAIWSLTSGNKHKAGWTTPDGWSEKMPIPEDFAPDEQSTVSPHGALTAACEYALKNKTQPFIMVVRDAHIHMKEPVWRRTVKDLFKKLRDTLGSLILLSVSDDIHPDMKHDITIVRPGLPDIKTLTRHVTQALSDLGFEADPHQCAMALRGLGTGQAKDLLKLDIVKNHGTANPERLSKLKAEKLASVHGVHFEGEGYAMGSVGGLDHYKAWLHKRLHALTPQAREAGIDEPKGCVFVGVPGGGKTLTARATAAKLKLPLISLNLSECEGGIVGETATRMAEALRTIDALAPCVVLIDEIEKALGSGGEHDGGSKRTLVRLLLIWLQERRSQVFTCITSNDISGLPPELTRKGRIDEIWFVDLPSRIDREAIVRIHLAKRLRSLTDSEIAKTALSVEGYTGSEIEEAIKEAILTAWTRQCEGGNGALTIDDVLAAAKDIVPMAVTYASKLDAIREWAKGRARRASDADVEAPPTPEKPKTGGEQMPAISADLFGNALKQPW